jgi:alkaline phosphatase D
MGPAELFLLDGRFFRDRGARCVLGDEQLDWLLDALEMSEAPVKIIASPTQVLAEAAVRRGWDCFRADAPDEAASLMAAIEARDIRGVIFVSGNTHLANLFHRPGRAGKGARGPEWWELTTSPLANWPSQVSIAGQDACLVSEVIDRCNYGIVDIDLERAGAEIMLFCKDEQGNILFQQPIALETLSVRR